jgi:hypothetical protein
MPPAAQGKVSQIDEKRYLVFKQFETMDTQSSRIALAPNRLAWLENLQPVGPNDLISVPGPNAAISTISGQTISKQFSYNINGIDYIACFTVAGAGFQVKVTDGSQTQIAPNGTFSNPDMTQWKSERILIADPTAGYCTWDNITFVKGGMVSPNLNITAGGSGYSTGANVAITGGTGGGATASATVVNGVVVALTLLTPGSGYVAGDVLTVTITPVGAGGGATATGRIWPILGGGSPGFFVSTVAVFQGRVWLAGGRNYQWTGTVGFDDTSAVNAAGSSILTDADLPHSITAFRSLNNFLYIFGDGSLKQIGSIAVASSVTVFTITTLSSDQGTIYPQSIASYNRLILFANQVGVYAIFGATVEKISDPMDGVFRALDFTQPPIACPNDINNIRCYLLLVRYLDPINGPRSIFLTFMNKKWFIVSQGSTIRCACTASIGGNLESFVSSGSDVTQIVQNNTVPVAIILKTALSDDGRPMQGKRGIRMGVVQQAQNVGTMLLTQDSENGSFNDQYAIAFPVTWLNNLGQVVTWQNNALAGVTFNGSGFLFEDRQMYASGIFLGASFFGTFAQFHMNTIMIEYKDAALMRSINRK